LGVGERDKGTTEEKRTGYWGEGLKGGEGEVSLVPSFEASD